MALGRRRDAWDHTAKIVAKVHNVNCTKKSDQVDPAELNPYRNTKAEAEELTPEVKAELRQMFNHGRKRRRNSSR